MYYVNAIYYFNNTIEVAMLLLGLNSFITNVIGLVIKKRAILLAWQQELKNQNH
ncbi:TPA: transcriptional regulator [Klebsiella pneumoniae]|nr:transcriptional regulator [Klebsiella pneumoniae]